jgi:phytoene dehydrogenase-like protein
MSAARDVIVIGGGHNGLITAFYLARAGCKPLVLEGRDTVGGAAATQEFHPGFRCSTLAHSAGPIHPSILRDMRLHEHGLSWVEPSVALFSPALDGRALLLHRDPAQSAREIEKLSEHDAASYPEFAALLEHFSSLVGRILSLTPPTINKPSAEDLWQLMGVGRQLRGLGRHDMMRLFRFGPMAVADFVSEFFDTELLRAAIAARGVLGASMGPWSAGSTAQLLLLAAADPHPSGRLVFPRGGMGALSESLAAAAMPAGAEIRTSAPVVRILVKDGAAAGVALASGEEISAKLVVSSADPRRTLLGLVDPIHLEPGFATKMQHYRMPGTLAKINLALDGLPPFTAAVNFGGSAPAESLLSGRILIAPEIDYLERAFDHSKYGEYSSAPFLDIAIASLSDTSLAPAGKHVMSIYAQFAPYRLRNGDWRSAGSSFADVVLRILAEYAPDLPGRVIARQVITPLDLEQDYGLTGGHIFHGELSLDQLFTMRPILGWARYGTPIRSLFLCGSGAHPGNGLTGLSAANASREIIKSLK